ncbi:hypothetical protein [Streptomyces griseorubiginosus]|uniref:hypothetical protein n=1 Tax=Streptomyces griseorubiginosus TaxID=67304 RepID=UPI0036E29672
MKTSSSSAVALRKGGEDGWANVLTRVRLAGYHHTITRHGTPAALLVPVQWHKSAGGVVSDTVDAEAASRGLKDLVDRAYGGAQLGVTYRDDGVVAVAVGPEWYASVTTSPGELPPPASS